MSQPFKEEIGCVGGQEAFGVGKGKVVGLSMQDRRDRKFRKD